MLQNARLTILLLNCLAVGLSDAIFFPQSDKCVVGEYWCQDRCGSDGYGQKCCQTPDGEHNLCGTGTICCKFGCCPSDSTCNNIGACERYITNTDSSGHTRTSTITVLPTGTPSVTGTASAPPKITPVITTNQGGQTVVIIDKDTITLPKAAGPTTITTHGQTITIPAGSPASTKSITIITATPSRPPAVYTTILDNGQTVVVIGPNSVVLPTVTSSTVITTLGQTITVVPQKPNGPITTVLPDGQTMVSNLGVVVIGTNTASLPSVSILTTLTTIGQTFILTPSPSITVSRSTDPTVSQATSTTFTESPPSTQQGSPSIFSSSGFVVISSHTIPVPSSISTPVTITTLGVTLTFHPSPTQLGSTTTTLKPSITTTGPRPLVTFSTWPPLSITPVRTSVREPEPTDDGVIIPCNLWFFFVCISWEGIEIGGWFFRLPPGVYLNGPPAELRFPAGIQISGSLPPWPPRLTIGNDGRPTYSPSQSPTSCKTQTASLCATTTSYGVSVSGQVTATTASRVLSTCANIAGCGVEDRSQTATITNTCKTSTATNVWISCTESPTRSCATTRTSIVSGCNVTPTTRSCTRTTTVRPSATGANGRRADGDDDVCVSELGIKHIVYPKNSGDRTQTDAIAAKLKAFVDPSTIETIEATCCGVVYWSLKLKAGQAQELRNDQTVSAVFEPCLDNCPDPLTGLVMQPGSPETLIFVDQAEKYDLSWYRSNYVYEESAGGGVPVYVIDTGVKIDHPQYQRSSYKPMARLKYLQTAEAAARYPDKRDPSGHGTSMLSQIVGHKVGLAKNVDPIMVQMYQFGGVQEFLVGLTLVLNDVEKIKLAKDAKKGDTKAVLSMSLFFKHVTDKLQHTATSEKVSWLLANLVDHGVFPVAGSGNDGANEVNGLPASLGARDHPEQTILNHIPGLIVAGAVNAKGEKWPMSNEQVAIGLPHIYAPGWDVVTADHVEASPPDCLKVASGTSLSTAQTAGLAAYIIGLARIARDNPFHLTEDISTPTKLKDYIVKLSWPRVLKYNAIFNGLSPVDAGTVLGGPSCPIIARSIPENELADWPDCYSSSATPSSSQLTSSTAPSPTTLITTTRQPPMPTLPGVPPSPTDSACLSTATITSCAVPGVGRPPVCATTTSCGSWGPKNTPPPGTRCETTDVCNQYQCAAGSHPGCHVNGIGGNRIGYCLCLPN